MPMFFIRPDPPDSVMYAAKSFALAEVKRLEMMLSSARSTLEAAQRDYDQQFENAGGGSTWDDPGSRKIERIEQTVDLYEKLLGSARLKLYWEGQRQFERGDLNITEKRAQPKIEVHPKAMPTPWKDDANNWLKFFKRRVA